MIGLARALENAAHWLEVEAQFLANHRQTSEAASMRKQAQRLREKASRCHQYGAILAHHAILSSSFTHTEEDETVQPKK